MGAMEGLQKLLILWGILFSFYVNGQKDSRRDTLIKIEHAEPLYVDFIRDIGAHKGERELNSGWGMLKEYYYLKHSGFIEYEFALFNRLGFEIEIPFSFYQSASLKKNQITIPDNRIEGIKLAAQYTFLVSPQLNTSLAIGYINEIKFHSFKYLLENSSYLKSNIFNPFFIIAKKWGNNIHTIIYAGSAFEHIWKEKTRIIAHQLNSSIFYEFNKGRKFAGIEMNQELRFGIIKSIVRPQIKLSVNSKLSIGVLTGIPVKEQNKGLSFLIRIIYEPSQKE